jgi:hypothetical protein
LPSPVILVAAISSSAISEVLIYPPSAVATLVHLLGHSHYMWPSPWQWWHLMSEEGKVKEEDRVILRAAGAVVVFVGAEEGKAHVALFEGTTGTREEDTLVLDVDGRGAKMVAPLLADY